MKSRTLIILASIVIIAIIVTQIFKGKTENAPEEKPAYEVETIMTSALTKEIVLQKSALMKAGTQANITAQSSGRIGGIYVRAGERVIAGQILAEIDDTYGTTNNARDEATIALETSRLSLASTTLSLDQSVASTKIAYEKAKKDNDAAKLSTTADLETGKSKAQLDYENFITTQEKTISSFETNYKNQLETFQIFITNVVESLDTLIGITEKNKELNDKYVYLLGARKPETLDISREKIIALFPYLNWAPTDKDDVLIRIQKLKNVYESINIALSATENVLLESLVDVSVFSETTRATQRAMIDTYQAQYSINVSSLSGMYNSVQTFFATYEKERLSREKTIQTTEENSLDTLQLAKNAYETAQKTREVTLKQLSQNIAAASVRLRNAQGNVNRLTITAPVSGVVGKVQVDEGEEVSAGRAIIDIASDDAECDITVDSATLAQFEVGTDVRVNYRGESLPGKIASISPIADKGLNFSVKI